MTLKKSLLGPLAVATALTAGVATAATQGQLGTASTGSINVSIQKGSAVKISKLDDVNFGGGSFDVLAQDLVAVEDFCVFSSSGRYGVTVVGNNAGSPSGFGMTNGTNMIPYKLVYNSLEIETEVPLGGQIGDQASEDCATGNNAVLEFLISPADFNQAAPGSYNDILFLFVSPE